MPWNIRLKTCDFNPRAPRGARRGIISGGFPENAVFQSTRPARGATTREIGLYLPLSISIHAPREGRDERYGVEIEE